VEKSTLFYYKYKCDPHLEAVMNYLKTYCNLIRKAEQRGYTKKKAKELEVYVEGHHTFPLSIFGKNNRIVYLTAREHYIAHALLERICIRRYGLEHWKTKKMMYAFWCLNNQKSKNTYLNSYFYEQSKLNFSRLHSENHSGYIQTKETKRKISEGNRGKVRTEEQRKKISIARIGTKMPKEAVEKIKLKNTGKKRTQEQKDRMSKARKGVKLYPRNLKNEEFRNRFIDAVKTSKTKKEIIRKLGRNPNNGSSSSSIDRWAKFLNLDMSHLIGVHINKGKIHTKETREKMSSFRKGQTKTNEHKKKIKLSNCKYVYTFISPDEIVTETVWYTDFCKENNLNPCKIREVTRGIGLHHKGWKATRRPRTEEDK
jgi:hypothetical protein